MSCLVRYCIAYPLRLVVGDLSRYVLLDMCVIGWVMEHRSCLICDTKLGSGIEGVHNDNEVAPDEKKG